MQEMEFRTNDLFKSYLQEKVVTKTPSPQPEVPKFRENVRSSEQSALNQSISSLCLMLKQCQVQLETSNNLISKIVSPDSEYLFVQKSQFREYIDEIRNEFEEMKSDFRRDAAVLPKQKKEDPVNESHRKPLNDSQNSIFSQNIQDNESSQKSLFSTKPLTPPSSFEAMIKKKEEYDTFSGHLEQAAKNEAKVNQEGYIPSVPNTTNFRASQSSEISFKVEKRRKSKIKSPSVSVRSSSTHSRMKHTQKWLDSLTLPPSAPSPIRIPKPPPQRMISNISNKRSKNRRHERDSDTGSVGAWSCRSVRTYKSSRKRSANFVKIEQASRSEAGWERDSKNNRWPNFRSEY